ncbi:hypothetical protein [Spirochaeta dissipatitropha]
MKIKEIKATATEYRQHFYRRIYSQKVVGESWIYTEKILKDLPDWFGDEAALQDYIRDVKPLHNLKGLFYYGIFYNFLPVFCF